MTTQTQFDPATLAVRAAVATDTQHGAVMPPLYLSTNYSFKSLGERRTYDYTRSGNPTRDQLGDALAALEGGEGAIVTASGMAALTLIAHLVPAKDWIIAPHDCYGGTFRLLTALHTEGRARVAFVDQSDAAALAAALAPSEGRVGLVLVETPSNPLLRVVNIREIADLCRQHGALLAVDNTFLSPLWQQPISLGADLVVHSTTKYLNGHSDVVGGAVVAATAALHEKLAWWGNCLGLTGAPFDAYLTLRGLRTLPVRLRAHAENAEAVVRLLSDHPAVGHVYYPGLATHPGHAIARTQQSGFGAIVSFTLAGGQAEVAAFLAGLACFTLAESLGGVESLVAHPATMTHAAMGPQARQRAGISDGLLRLSIGIEAAADLLQDLQAGLARALVVSTAKAQADATTPATSVRRLA